jgi:AcrR family transcriptional regulator
MKATKKAVKANDPKRLVEIYNVAAKIICDKGFDAMSMNDIAQAVGMTKAGVYHYIQGKKEMLFEIMSYGMDQLDRGVIAPAMQVEDPEVRLQTIIFNHAQLITRGNNALTVLVDEVAGLTPINRKKIRQRKRAYFDFVRDTLSQLQLEGKLKDINPTVAAFSILGMLLWISRWYHPNGKLTAEQVSEEILKVAIGGTLHSPIRVLRKLV